MRGHSDLIGRPGPLRPFHNANAVLSPFTTSNRYTQGLADMFLLLQIH